MQNIVSKGISHGVYIVTVRTKEKINGMTAAWISQVSFNPLLLMASIGLTKFSHDLIKESGYFAINTLDEDMQNYAAVFGFKSGRKADKFQGVFLTSTLLTARPVLDRSAVFFRV